MNFAYSKLKNSLTLFLCFSLLFSSYDGMGGLKDKAQVPFPKKRFWKTLKMELAPYAFVEKTSFPLNSDGDHPLVIYIQDMHCNFEAQISIAKAIEIVASESGIVNRKNKQQTTDPYPQSTIPGLLVLTEGALGPVDLKFWADFPDQKIKKAAMEKALKQGIVTGPEFLGIVQPEKFPIQIVGLEDPRLYLEDFKTFRETFSKAQDARGAWKDLQKWLEDLKNKNFPPVLHQIEACMKRFETGEAALEKILESLNQMMILEQFQRMVFGGGLSWDLILPLCSLKDFPNLKMFLQVTVLGHSGPKNQFEEAIHEAVQNMNSKVSEEELKALIQKGLELRLGKITQDDFLSSLISLIKKYGDLRLFPVLEQYEKMMKIQSRIQTAMLWTELKGWIEKIERVLSRNTEERELIALSRKFDSFDQSLRLELGREEFSSLKIDQNSDLAFSNETRPIPPSLAGALLCAKSFYEIALAREKAMIQNALVSIEKSKASVVVLVAGGFHSSGISRALRKKKFPFMILSPRLQTSLSMKAYQGLMLDPRIHFSSPERSSYQISSAKYGLAFVSIFNPLADLLGTSVRQSFLEGLADDFIAAMRERGESVSEAIRIWLKGEKGLTASQLELLRVFRKRLGVVEERQGEVKKLGEAEIRESIQGSDFATAKGILHVLRIMNHAHLGAAEEEFRKRTFLPDSKPPKKMALLPAPRAENTMPRTAKAFEDYDLFRKALDREIREKDQMSPRLFTFRVMSILREAGLLSNEALNRLREEQERDPKALAQRLVFLCMFFARHTAYAADSKSPEQASFLEKALKNLGLQMGSVEGHPLILSIDENLRYRDGTLSIEKLLPAASLRLRAQNQRRPAPAAADAGLRESPTEEVLKAGVSGPGVLVLVGENGERGSSGNNGSLTRWRKALPIHNEKEFSETLLELSMGSDEDLEDALRLLFLSPAGSRLYRVLEQSRMLLGYETFVRVFEKMKVPQAARFLKDVAAREFDSAEAVKRAALDFEEDGDESCVTWFALLLGEMTPRHAVEILEEWLFSPRADSYARSLAEAVLWAGFQMTHSNVIGVWEILAARHAAEIFSPSEYAGLQLGKRALFKNPWAQKFRSLLRIASAGESIEEYDYRDLKNELETLLERIYNNSALLNDEQVEKELRRLSRLIFLGQNGDSAYETVLRPQRYSELLPHLFLCQPPEILAVFLTEAGSVEEENNARYLWLLELMSSKIFPREFLLKVVELMLLDERFRLAGSHRALQRIFERALVEGNFWDFGWHLVEELREKAEPGVYNEPEIVLATGVFLVKDLTGDLRDEAIRGAVHTIEQLKKSEHVKPLTSEEPKRSEPNNDNLQWSASTAEFLQTYFFSDDPEMQKKIERRRVLFEMRGAIGVLCGAGLGKVRVSGAPLARLSGIERSALSSLASLVHGPWTSEIKEAARGALAAARNMDAEAVLINEYNAFADIVSRVRGTVNETERREVLLTLLDVSLASDAPLSEGLKNVLFSLLKTFKEYQPRPSDSSYREAWSKMQRLLKDLEECFSPEENKVPSDGKISQDHRLIYKLSLILAVQMALHRMDPEKCLEGAFHKAGECFRDFPERYRDVVSAGRRLVQVKLDESRAGIDPYEFLFYGVGAAVAVSLDSHDEFKQNLEAIETLIISLRKQGPNFGKVFDESCIVKLAHVLKQNPALFRECLNRASHLAQRKIDPAPFLTEIVSLFNDFSGRSLPEEDIRWIMDRVFEFSENIAYVTYARQASSKNPEAFFTNMLLIEHIISDLRQDGVNPGLLSPDGFRAAFVACGRNSKGFRKNLETLKIFAAAMHQRHILPKYVRSRNWRVSMGKQMVFYSATQDMEDESFQDRSEKKEYLIGHEIFNGLSFLPSPEAFTEAAEKLIEFFDTDAGKALGRESENMHAQDSETLDDAAINGFLSGVKAVFAKFSGKAGASSAPRIGKDLHVNRVISVSDQAITAEVSEIGNASAPGREISLALSLRAPPRPITDQDKTAIEGSAATGREDILRQMLALLPPNLRVYATLTLERDLFGFADPSHHMIALHESIASHPVALFHELGEYLIASGALTLEFSKNSILIFGQGKAFLGRIELLQDTLDFIRAERWETGWEKNPHYLLRILQREIFSERDKELSRLIIVEKLKPREAQKLLKARPPAAVVRKIDNAFRNEKDFQEALSLEMRDRERTSSEIFARKVLDVLIRAGVVSAEAVRELEQMGSIADLCQRLTFLSRYFLGENGDSPEQALFLKEALRGLSLELVNVEGHPLILSLDENIRLRDGTLSIQDLIPAQVLRKRALAQREAVSDGEQMRPAGKVPASDGVPMTALAVITGGSGGALSRFRGETVVHNEKEFAEALHRLSQGDEEDLENAKNLILFSSMGRKLYQVLKNERMLWSHETLGRIFNRIRPQTAARLLLESAGAEFVSVDEVREAIAQFESEGEESGITWFALLLDGMESESRAAILEKMLFHVKAAPFSKALAEGILMAGHRMALSGIIEVWDTLARRHPAEMYILEEFNQQMEDRRSVLRPASVLSILGALIRRAVNGEVQEDIHYENLRGELAALFKNLHENSDALAEKEIQKKIGRLSNLILLGQNGNTAYETILRPQEHSDLIPYLFICQNPEVLAFFLTETAGVEDATDGRYTWLMNLIQSKLFPQAMIHRVFTLMLFDERFRQAGSHRSLQHLFEQGLLEGDTMGFAHDLVRELTSQREEGVYNAPEIILSTGIFLVRDLTGDLRETAIACALKKLDEFEKNFHSGIASYMISRTAEEDVRRKIPRVLLGTPLVGDLIETFSRYFGSVPVSSVEDVSAMGEALSLNNEYQRRHRAGLAAIAILREVGLGRTDEQGKVHSLEIKALRPLAHLTHGEEIDFEIKEAASEAILAASPEAAEAVLLDENEGLKQPFERLEIKDLLLRVSARSSSLSRKAQRFYSNKAAGDVKTCVDKLFMILVMRLSDQEGYLLRRIREESPGLFVFVEAHIRPLINEGKNVVELLQYIHVIVQAYKKEPLLSSVAPGQAVLTQGVEWISSGPSSRGLYIAARANETDAFQGVLKSACEMAARGEDLKKAAALPWPRSYLRTVDSSDGSPRVAVDVERAFNQELFLDGKGIVELFGETVPKMTALHAANPELLEAWLGEMIELCDEHRPGVLSILKHHGAFFREEYVASVASSGRTMSKKEVPYVLRREIISLMTRLVKKGMGDVPLYLYVDSAAKAAGSDSEELHKNLEFLEDWVDGFRRAGVALDVLWNPELLRLAGLSIQSSEAFRSNLKALQEFIILLQNKKRRIRLSFSLEDIEAGPEFFKEAVQTATTLLHFDMSESDLVQEMSSFSYFAQDMGLPDGFTRMEINGHRFFYRSVASDSGHASARLSSLPEHDRRRQVQAARLVRTLAVLGMRPSILRKHLGLREIWTSRDEILKRLEALIQDFQPGLSSQIKVIVEKIGSLGLDDARANSVLMRVGDSEYQITTFKRARAVGAFKIDLALPAERQVVLLIDAKRGMSKDQLTLILHGASSIEKAMPFLEHLKLERLGNMIVIGSSSGEPVLPQDAGLSNAGLAAVEQSA